MAIFKRKQETITVQVQGTVLWEYAQDAATKSWVGVCRPLNINAVGETWRELMDCAAEAMSLLFVDLLQTGELDAFLRHHGWSLASGTPPRTEHVEFDMPFSFEKAGSADELMAHA